MEDFNQLVIEPLLEKILKEKKQCSLLGDFNINLLKYDSHKETRDFLNSMTSAFFSPFILQPTRLSSKSLIDNKFFWKLFLVINKNNKKLQRIQTTGGVKRKLNKTKNTIPKKLPIKFNPYAVKLSIFFIRLEIK